MELDYYDFIMNMLESFIIINFFNIYFRFKIKQNYLLFASMLVIKTFFVTLVNIYYFDKIIIYSLEIIIDFLYCFYISRKNIKESIFMTVLNQTLLSTVNVSTYLMYSHISYKNVIPLYEFSDLNYYILVFISKLILFIFTIIIGVSRNKYEQKLKNIDFVFLIVSITLIYLIYKPFENIVLLKDYNINYISFGAICLAILAAFLIILYFNILRDKQKFMESQLKLKLLEFEIEKQKESKKSYDKIVHIKHDIKHIFNNIRFNLKENNVEAIKRAINYYEDELNSVSFINNIDNLFLSYLINNFKERAIESGISFKCSINSKVNIPIDDNDLSILIGNAFDNAIENCGGIKEILLEIKEIKNHVIFIVENSIDSEMARNFITSKNQKYHGYGIKSMKDIVEKYDGYMEFNSFDYKFVCKILLKNNQIP